MKTRFAGLRFRLTATSLGLIHRRVYAGTRLPISPRLRAPQWQEAGNAAVDTRHSEYRDWWNVFNDPVLSRLIEIAYDQSLTLQSAGAPVLCAAQEHGRWHI